MDSRYSTGTGIENIKQRLEKYYAKHYRFETHSEEGLVKVEIEVPQKISDRRQSSGYYEGS